MVRHLAKLNPEVLVVGVDANADHLRTLSRRLSLKVEKGGATNALFGRLSLEDAPGELVGLADALTVYLPWGSLLHAVARPEPTPLLKLRELCKPGARVKIVFGYDPATEPQSLRDLGLLLLDESSTLRMLEREYRAVGFGVTACSLTADEVRDLPTTWAKKLSSGGRPRPFVALQGQVFTVAIP